MKKGFTLIELLAVIVILAVIALIATPIILGIINDTKKQAFEVEAKNIEDAAEYYLTKGLRIEEVPKYEEYYIPVSDLTNYINNLKDEMLDESVIVKKTDNSINYYYTGRDKNPYLGNQTLKAAIESDTTHILTNKKVNGINVNKVIGTRAQKITMKNWVWYSGQLWQVLETNNDYVKLITANSVTSIVYGTTSDWNASWVRKWSNAIDSNSTQDGIYYNNLSRTDMLLNGQFCLDEPTGVTEALNFVTDFTPINTCSIVATDKIGLMTFEDYVYSLDGNGINGAVGGSYIDEDELEWTMTKYTIGGATTRIWMTYYDNPSHIGHAYTITRGNALGVRPVIYLSSSLKIEEDNSSNYGTINNPYRLVGEQVLTNNDDLNGVTIGSYIYLSEANNSYATSTEAVTSRLSYSYDKTKVRYRVIGINSDGSIKVERADVLRSLPSTISDNGIYVPYYYKQNTCDVTAGVYTDCNNNNYYKPTEGSGAYAYNDSENIGYYLNNADNSYYNWLSNSVKSNIVTTNWNLPVGASGSDYATSLFNTTYTGTYSSRSNDGLVASNIGLPTWGDMFSGNDLNINYWYINRWADSSFLVSLVSKDGYADNHYASAYSLCVRPVLRLKSNIKVTGGSGTPNSPYTLDI